VDAALLDSLQPTHIITQSQCEVCAVSLRDVEEAAYNLIKSNPRIVSLEPNRLEDVWRDIEVVAKELHVEAAAADLINRLKARIAAIHGKAKSLVREPVKCAYIEWIDPLMAGGNWMPQLIEAAGAINIFGETGRHSPPLDWDAFLEADPDVIIVAPCGFDIKRTSDEMIFLTRRSGFSNLKAVHNHRVFIADGNQYFNRPGPRLVESLEIIAELCYPEIFHFGHQTTGWIPFEFETIGG
jgi:iron complex transport system substrate-binding protein